MGFKMSPYLKIFSKNFFFSNIKKKIFFGEKNFFRKKKWFLRNHETFPTNHHSLRSVESSPSIAWPKEFCLQTDTQTDRQTDKPTLAPPTNHLTRICHKLAPLASRVTKNSLFVE